MKAAQPTPLNARAMRYMADSMAMNKPLDDQGQNWILGHLATFAASELRNYRKLLVGIVDAATVGIDRSPADALKPRDRAPFKGGALWALVNLRKDLMTSPDVLLKRALNPPRKQTHRHDQDETNR